MSQDESNLGKSDSEMQSIGEKENTANIKNEIIKDPSFTKKNLNYLNFRILDRAAEAGNYELVKFIVEKDPQSVKYISPNTETDALKCALSKGHKEICEYLIDHGAEFAITDPFKPHPLYYLISSCQFDLAKFYMEKYKIPPTLVITLIGEPVWAISMVDYVQTDSADIKKKKIDFFRYCTSKMKPGDIQEIEGFNWLEKASTYDHVRDFFDELVRLQAILEIRAKPSWSSNPIVSAMKCGDEYIVKQLLKNYRSISTFVPDWMGPDLIGKEYSKLSSKWERLLDIYTVRTMGEFVLGIQQNIPSLISENEEIKNAYNHISSQKIKSAIFRVSRKFFSNVIKLLPLYPTELRPGDL